MANFSLTLPFATALLVVIGICGCEAVTKVQCPYWDGAAECRSPGADRCNATSCDNGALCCTLSCAGARCLSRDKVCPQVSRGTECTAAQSRKHCTTRSCEQGASCCSNDCGGTSCIAKDKSGTCPALPTGFFGCPVIIEGTTTTTCASDTNCAGAQKCCPTICSGHQCTTPDS